MNTMIERDKKLLSQYFDWMIKEGGGGEFFESRYYADISGGVKLTEERIVGIINMVFDMPNDKWVTDRNREQRKVVCRQVLMSILRDYMGYSWSRSAAVCNRNHATAIHSRKTLQDTLWNDMFYGKMVKRVYEKCELE